MENGSPTHLEARAGHVSAGQHWGESSDWPGLATPPVSSHELNTHCVCVCVEGEKREGRERREGRGGRGGEGGEGGGPANRTRT